MNSTEGRRIASRVRQPVGTRAVQRRLHPEGFFERAWAARITSSTRTRPRSPSSGCWRPA